MKIYYSILIVFACISCSKVVSDRGDKIQKKITVKSDTTKINLEEATVMQINIIDEMDSLYYSKIEAYRDSLLKTVDLDKIPYIEPQQKGKLIKIGIHTTPRVVNSDDIAKYLQEALMTGNLNLLQDLSVKVISHEEKTDMVPYFLYMGEKYDLFGAYLEIYYIYESLDFDRYVQQKNDNSLIVLKEYKYNYPELGYLTNQERDLAMWSLITAYKKGDFQAALYLSSLFKEGRFLFPKNELVSHKLDSIFDIRYKSSYWNDSVYVP